MRNVAFYSAGYNNCRPQLIECKKEVPHGQWLNWLQANFNLSRQMANGFIRIAERFANVNLNLHLNQTQLIALLALPPGEEEHFIAEKSLQKVHKNALTSIFF